ncbi:MAG TPA: hypothetical protein PLK55_01640 [archaeon]|nr:hypothetical protein [archaeon]
MTKKVTVLYSKPVEETLTFLEQTKENNKISKSIYNSFLRKIELIKSNPGYGDNIPKPQIPKEYIEKYKINNLFRLELANYWRCLYSLTDKKENTVEIIAFVIDLLDHNKYNKKFKYK